LAAAFSELGDPRSRSAPHDLIDMAFGENQRRVRELCGLQA